jgi:hypothetical protein
MFNILYVEIIFIFQRILSTKEFKSTSRNLWNNTNIRFHAFVSKQTNIHIKYHSK